LLNAYMMFLSSRSRASSAACRPVEPGTLGGSHEGGDRRSRAGSSWAGALAPGDTPGRFMDGVAGAGGMFRQSAREGTMVTEHGVCGQCSAGRASPSGREAGARRVFTTRFPCASCASQAHNACRVSEVALATLRCSHGIPL
jgi:hypothetical protein